MTLTKDHWIAILAAIVLVAFGFLLGRQVTPAPQPEASPPPWQSRPPQEHVLPPGMILPAEPPGPGLLTPAPEEALFGSRIPRTMTLLQTGTRDGRAPVKILFYGQSIMNRYWTGLVEADLRRRFPRARIQAENRAIGGFGAPMLCRTAAHDVYPFYPDLLIFHVYGGVHDRRLERFIAEVRRKTTAEIMLLTHHVNTHNAPDGQDESSRHWRYLAQKYNCELVDVRKAWKQYMRDHHRSAGQLVYDTVHPTNEGSRVIAAAVIRHLRYNPASPAGWVDRVRTYEVKRAVEECDDAEVTFSGKPWIVSRACAVGADANSSLKLTFQGNRVDILGGGWVSPQEVTGDPNARGIKLGTARILIDGEPPSADPNLYAITRPSPAPNIWFPALRRISHRKPLLLEKWTLEITKMSEDAKEFTYQVSGSRTGPDGAGNSKERFVSGTGRVVIEPDDFEFLHGFQVSKKVAPVGFKVTWEVVPLFQDVYPPPDLKKGQGAPARVTVAKLLSNTRHTLEIVPNGDGFVPIEAIEIHRPPLR